MDPRYYQASGGSEAPIAWYASLPDHVKRLYDYRGLFSAQPALMVVLAEVVCEAFTIWALEELFKKKNLEALWKTLYGQNKRRYQDICDPRVHSIYTALSGDQITQRVPLWEKLMQHNNRRNALVHPGPSASTAAIPSQPEAEESIKAVEDYIQHVYQILNSI